MDTFRTDQKIKKLKRNIDVSLEREVRQKEKVKRRTIRSEERQQMREKWVEGAKRVEKRLPELWNPKKDEARSSMILPRSPLCRKTSAQSSGKRNSHIR